MYRIDFGSLCTEYVHTVFLAKKKLIHILVHVLPGNIAMLAKKK